MHARNRFAGWLGALGLLLVLGAGAVPGTAAATAGVTPPARPAGYPFMCSMATPQLGWESVLTGVTVAPSPTLGRSAVWAVGYYKPAMPVGANVQTTLPLILRYEGKAWTPETLPALPPNTILTAVAASSANDVWAVGYTAYDYRDSPVALHYSGGVWTQLPNPLILRPASAAPPASMRFTGVAALAPKTPLVIGSMLDGSRSRPVILTYAGDGWRFADLAQLPDGTQLTGVTAPTAKEAWVVGWTPTTSSIGPNPRSVLLAFNGVSWKVKAQVAGQLTAVTSLDNTVIAVGQSYEPGGVANLAMRYGKAGLDWARVKTPNLDVDHNFLQGVTTWNGEVYAVGYAGSAVDDTQTRPMVMRYDGFAFEPMMLPGLGPVSRLNAVVGGVNLWAVGAYAPAGQDHLMAPLVLTTQCPMQ
jgi:hypothetical protein